MQAWTVPAMRPIFWQIDTPIRPYNSRLHTTLQPRDATAALRGQAVWIAHLDQGTAAVAWDWVTVRGVIPILQDPLTIITNIQLRVDDEAITSTDTNLYLNHLLHHLDWQAKVRRFLRSRNLH